ncbi:MAG: universal stress protein, partial [Candidatus Xenobia bacterium]
YLGYAPRIGKTVRLLDEARRRQSRGEDVVVGWLREKDLDGLKPRLDGLEQIPPRRVGEHGEMDCEAILQRRPQVCIVDELAHRNQAGSAREHRWQDVELLLDAGIDVVTAVNIQYMAGVSATIERLLGQTPTETVPDEMVRSADEVALVDARPDAARDDEKRLQQLREVALLYAAAAVEEHVREYRQEHQIETTWQTQERILVCVTPHPRGPWILERARQTAERWKAEMFALYVTPEAGMFHLSKEDTTRLLGYLKSAKDQGAHTDIVESRDPGAAILTYSRQHEITQIFIGHGNETHSGALSRTLAGRIILEAEGIDVHVVADDHTRGPRRTVVEEGKGLPAGLARLLAGGPAPTRRAGRLRVYLGYAPGVGKTHQMLADGLAVQAEGIRVVLYCLEVAARPGLTDLVPQLTRVESLEKVLEERPQLCLVDGVAHRWPDVETLLDAGIQVFTTLDVFELENLQDAVEQITGQPVPETAPDWLLEQADDVIFVDVAPRALMNRVQRGAIFPGGEIPERYRGYFKEGSLSALRELAMRRTAHAVEHDLKAREGETEATETLLVCLDRRPGGASIVRRASRAAERLQARCFVVFVAPDEDWTGVSPEDRKRIEEHLALAQRLHLEPRVLYGAQVARTLVDFAIRHKITQVFLGRSRKSGWREFFQRSVIEQLIRMIPWTDVHVVAERVPTRQAV